MICKCGAEMREEHEEIEYMGIIYTLPISWYSCKACGRTYSPDEEAWTKPRVERCTKGAKAVFDVNEPLPF
ncbi:hypothetical protein ULO1_15490 [Carboxydocella sp. ULO1]|nr:hypothetical protein ULO1_15490 [Carboxydocella sp. ULO1]